MERTKKLDDPEPQYNSMHSNSPKIDCWLIKMQLGTKLKSKHITRNGVHQQEQQIPKLL